jgi:hypothetical protein
MRLTRTLGTCLLALAAPALAQEGHMEMKISSAQGGMGGTAHTWFAKGGSRSQIEFQTPMGPMKMTSLTKASEPGVVYMLDDAKKTYSVFDAKAAEGKGEPSKETFTVKPLGKDSVAGYSCEKALVTGSRGTEMEICCSKEIPAWREMRYQMARSEKRSSYWKSLEDANVEGFPLRLRAGKGAQAITWELVKFEKTSVPTAMLEVPAGYQKVEGYGAIAGALPPEAQKQLEGAMKNLTPEQRKQIEEMMKQQQKGN